ncbi:hypothetical protein [Anaerotignum sp.]
MNDLNTTTKLVKYILENNQQTRNSDSFLYLKVLEHVANQKGIHLNGLTVPDFLTSMNVFGFPGFETVRRTRQKIQAECPDLAACDKVQAMRIENEQAFKAYALGVLDQ